MQIRGKRRRLGASVGASVQVIYQVQSLYRV
nr:MAG TPA: hypothetical protein [Caudoviricetes sp.]